MGEIICRGGRREGGIGGKGGWEGKERGVWVRGGRWEGFSLLARGCLEGLRRYHLINFFIFICVPAGWDGGKRVCAAERFMR